MLSFWQPQNTKTFLRLPRQKGDDDVNWNSNMYSNTRPLRLVTRRRNRLNRRNRRCRWSRSIGYRRSVTELGGIVRRRNGVTGYQEGWSRCYVAGGSLCGAIFSFFFLATFRPALFVTIIVGRVSAIRRPHHCLLWWNDCNANISGKCVAKTGVLGTY